MTQVRLLRWHDLPLVYRLIGHGTSFDAQFSLTVGDDGLRHSLLANNGNMHVYVLKQQGSAFGVLRCPPKTLYAGLAYLAPALDAGGSEEQWLELIAGMSILAGRQGIAAIRAEVGDDTPEFTALREAEFGIYAHQTLWERPPAPIERTRPSVRAAAPQEVGPLVEALNARAPSLLRQANVPLGTDAECYVLDAPNAASGMAAVYRGSRRALIDLYLPLDAHCAAETILSALMGILDAEAYAVTCRLRQDMEWLGTRLSDAGFQWVGSQAIMVRHTLAHIRHHALKDIKIKKGLALPTTNIRETEPAAPGVPDTTAQPM